MIVEIGNYNYNNNQRIDTDSQSFERSGALEKTSKIMVSYFTLTSEAEVANSEAELVLALSHTRMIE